MRHDHPDRSGALEEVRHLVLAVAGVHPERGGAERAEGKLGDHVLQHVRQPQRHHVAVADAPPGQVVRQRPGGSAQPVERQRAVALHERDP